MNHSQIFKRRLHTVLNGKFVVTHFRQQGREHVFKGKRTVKLRVVIIIPDDCIQIYEAVDNSLEFVSILWEVLDN